MYEIDGAEEIELGLEIGLVHFLSMDGIIACWLLVVMRLGGRVWSGANSDDRSEGTLTWC